MQIRSGDPNKTLLSRIGTMGLSLRHGARLAVAFIPKLERLLGTFSFCEINGFPIATTQKKKKKARRILPSNKVLVL